LYIDAKISPPKAKEGFPLAGAATPAFFFKSLPGLEFSAELCSA